MNPPKSSLRRNYIAKWHEVKAEIEAIKMQLQNKRDEAMRLECQTSINQRVLQSFHQYHAFMLEVLKIHHEELGEPAQNRQCVCKQEVKSE